MFMATLSLIYRTLCIHFLVVDMKKIIFILGWFPIGSNINFGCSPQYVIRSFGIFEYIASRNQGMLAFRLSIS
jgi:hypothetical protein